MYIPMNHRHYQFKNIFLNDLGIFIFLADLQLFLINSWILAIYLCMLFNQCLKYSMFYEYS